MASPSPSAAFPALSWPHHFLQLLPASGGSCLGAALRDSAGLSSWRSWEEAGGLRLRGTPCSPQEVFSPQNVDREKGLYPPVVPGSWVMLMLCFLVGIWATPPARCNDPSAVTTEYLHTTRQARTFHRLWEHLQDFLLLQVCL